jgi:hypothetical protein
LGRTAEVAVGPVLVIVDDGLFGSPVTVVELLTDGLAVAEVVVGFAAAGASEARDLTGVVLLSAAAVLEIAAADGLELVEEANDGFFSAAVAELVVGLGPILERDVVGTAVEPVILLDIPLAAAFFLSSPLVWDALPASSDVLDAAVNRRTALLTVPAAGDARVGGLFRLLPRVEGRVALVVLLLLEARLDGRLLVFEVVGRTPRFGGAVAAVKPRFEVVVVEDLLAVGEDGADGFEGVVD